MIAGSDHESRVGFEKPHNRCESIAFAIHHVDHVLVIEESRSLEGLVEPPFFHPLRFDEVVSTDDPERLAILARSHGTGDVRKESLGRAKVPKTAAFTVGTKSELRRVMNRENGPSIDPTKRFPDVRRKDRCRRNALVIQKAVRRLECRVVQALRKAFSRIVCQCLAESNQPTIQPLVTKVSVLELFAYASSHDQL